MSKEQDRDEKGDLIKRIRQKLGDEGYQVPTVSAINPEMRSGNWCGSQAFDFISDPAETSFVWVRQIAVAAGDLEEYLKIWQKRVLPTLKELREQNILHDMKMLQQMVGGEHTFTSLLFFRSMADIEKFVRQFRVAPGESAAGKEIKRLNALAKGWTESLMIEIMTQHS